MKIKAYWKIFAKLLYPAILVISMGFIFVQQIQIKQRDNKISKLQEQNTRLERALDATRSDFLIMEAEINRLQEQISILQGKYYQVKSELDSLSTYNSHLQQYTLELEKSFRIITTRINQLSKFVHKLNQGRTTAKQTSIRKPERPHSR